MKTYSDKERFEVQLVDGEGNTNTFIARVRNYDFVTGWGNLVEERQKAVDEKENEKAIELQYKMIAFLFGVDFAVMKEYSNETIVDVIKDYGEYVQKKRQAQENTEK